MSKILFFISLFFVLLATPVQAVNLVAHAGGAIDGYANTNSLEAIENAAASGFRYIELDLIPTSDGRIVLNHSWETVSNRIPGVRNGIMSHAEFMNHRIFNKFTPVDLEVLIDFLRENPGPRIITDTKDTDYAALYIIAGLFPEQQQRFIPQVYHFADVARIRALGFNDIILTLYEMNHMRVNFAAIHQFAIDEGLYAVTVPEAWLGNNQLHTDEVRYMVHTINSPARAWDLFRDGFYAVYSAFLTYHDEFGLKQVPLPIENFDIPLPEEGMVFKINVPVFAHPGGISPIISYHQMGAPFVHPVTEKVYLRVAHFARHYSGLEWQDNVLKINVGGFQQVVHDAYLYSDTIFISETVIERLFPYRVIRDGDIVVLAYE